MSPRHHRGLEKRLEAAEESLAYYKSLVDAFWSGEAPVEGNSLQHIIFAQWGRKRQESMKGVPKLLRCDG